MEKQPREPKNGNGEPEPKDGGADLSSLRERYFAVLEREIVLPLQNELMARDQQLRERVEMLDPEAPDASIVRRGVQAEADKVQAALDILENGLVRLRSVHLGELHAFAMPRSASE